MKTMRNSIIGLSLVYLLGNAIGCAPVQKKDPNAELDALLREPVQEMILRPLVQEPKEELGIQTNLSYHTEVARAEAGRYLQVPERTVPIFQSPKAEDLAGQKKQVEQLYQSCREELKEHLPKDTHIFCQGGEKERYIPCEVRIEDRTYSVKAQTQQLQKQGIIAAYITLLRRDSGLLDRLAETNCRSEMDFETD